MRSFTSLIAPGTNTPATRQQDPESSSRFHIIMELEQNQWKEFVTMPSSENFSSRRTLSYAHTHILSLPLYLSHTHTHIHTHKRRRRTRKENVDE